MTVAITREGLTASDLREAATHTRDAKMARRMLAIALVLEGWSRATAAQAGGMDRQTLRDWVHRFNAAGIEGLADHPRRNGPLPRLSLARQAKVAEWVKQGPDLERDGVVRWRCCDLQRRIKREFGVTLHESTIGRMLHRLGFQPRPHHPKKDTAAQEAFKDDLATSVAAIAPVGKPLEIWFADEARVGQQGTLTYIWAERGARPEVVRDNRHDSAYLFGAICPKRCLGAAIIMPGVNSEAMAEHLKEISRRVAPGAHAVLILDGAGWHQISERMPVPKNISLLPLPPYAPELNPIENVWAFLRGNFLSHRLWKSYRVILNACRDAWNQLMQMPEQIASLTQRSWLKPVTG